MKELTIGQLHEMNYSEMPLISVIVAVYNIEKYIEKCILSLINQTYTNLEIILVDDGATDSSGQICDSYAKKDERIKVIHRENGGLSAARNTGIESAGGEYISFVDGDDWIDADMYECLVKAAVSFSAELVACRYRCVYPEITVDNSTDRVLVFEGTKMLEKYLEEDENCLIQHAAWNKLYKRELLLTERFPEGKWYEDVVFSAKMLANIQTGVYLDSAKYNYILQRQGSIMSQGINKRMLTDLLPAYLEKERVLEQCKDPALVVLHQYHYLKKMMLWYRELHTKNSNIAKQDKEVWMQEIRKVFMDRKDIMHRVYACPLCTRNDRIKFKIFISMPKFFCKMMQLNDATILKLKLLIFHK